MSTRGRPSRKPHFPHRDFWTASRDSHLRVAHSTSNRATTFEVKLTLDSANLGVMIISKVGTSASRSKMSLVNTRLINWSSFFFAVLQSVCSAFIALGSVRLLIGLGAFAAASSVLKLADRMHIDAIRIPMMLLALAGSLLNLIVLWQVWRLRRRSASAWRQQPVSKQKKVSEWFQLALSVVTLFLLAAEFVAHRIVFAGR
jgi:hypothetical protein